MKLIIKQYLSSLKERDELDAILPDLLSQMGLNVISRPQRGTRQSGVDVAAIGKIDSVEEKVYLFSIKSGDLTRKMWNGDAIQSLRPSLDEILDAYIPTRLPEEHKDKKIVVCICIGGDIQEQVRTDVEGYFKKNKSKNLTFEGWNGDKLANLISDNFLKEDLLPQNARVQLRKSLALLDEPDASFKHFSVLVRTLLQEANLASDEKVCMIIRQLNICLWILFAWAREIGNLESAYLSSELAALCAWEIAKPYSTKDTVLANSINVTLLSILALYQQVSTNFLFQKILPHVTKRHALSVAVHPSNSLDINLKMFDVLGRLALSGVWAYSGSRNESDSAVSQSLLQVFQAISEAIKQLVLNNPTLLLPIKDEHAIDISIAVFVMMFDVNNHQFIREWLLEIVNRSSFAYKTHGQYPCILRSYSDLLEHPEVNNDEYRKRVTSGSALFSHIALWASLLKDENLYESVQNLKKDLLPHSNFQMWFPDDLSENNFFINEDVHGAVLSHVCVDRSPKELLEQVFGECERTNYFDEISAVKSGVTPLLFVACRHYRLPLPPHLWKPFYEKMGE
jgi:hypothetical protein